GSRNPESPPARGSGKCTAIPTMCPGCSSAARTAGSPAGGNTWTRSRRRSGGVAWDHVSARLAGQGHARPSELERALAVDDLLRRAHHGPPDGTDTETADQPSLPAA